MFPEYEQQIREEAVACFPNEGVWLITESGCRQVKNVHPEPEKFFRISKADTAKGYSEGLLAIVHSHVDHWDVPSAADMQGQENTGVPWGILTAGAEGAGPIRWWGGEIAPLIGRPFVHGISDCYALLRDYFKIERGVDLPVFPRDWGWWNTGQSLLTEGVEEAGFHYISEDDVQEGDIYFAQMRGKVPHHCGVYVGGGLILHQLGAPGEPVDYSRISAREPIGRYTGFICSWLRYTE